ncbi:MAG TPA: hypothetical protein PK728_07920 [Bacillota bacterium]|nr:hypothetical protein [Bacillota bacterium]
MSYRLFTWLTCLILALFLIFHLILYQYTKEILFLPEKVLKRSAVTGRCEPSRHVEVTATGDLARLSHLYGLGVYRTVADTSDSRGYLNKEHVENASFPVVAAGDSFMWYNGDEGRFTSLLEKKIGAGCYNMSANGVEDPFAFLQSDLQKSAKVLVWEAGERTITADTFNPAKTGFYRAEAKRKLEYRDNWDGEKTFKYRLRVINSSNIKFLVNNISYAITGKPLLGKVSIARLKNGRDLMFYKDDLASFGRPGNPGDLKLIVDFISSVDRELKDTGTTLIFFAVPDKYNAYYEQITDDWKIQPDSDFIRKLTGELQKNNVIAINLIDPYRDRIRQGAELYHFDDTHWNCSGAEIAAELVAQEIKKRGLLD